jgi:hypothetical protein
LAGRAFVDGKTFVRPAGADQALALSSSAMSSAVSSSDTALTKLSTCLVLVALAIGAVN